MYINSNVWLASQSKLLKKTCFNHITNKTYTTLYEKESSGVFDIVREKFLRFELLSILLVQYRYQNISDFT